MASRKITPADLREWIERAALACLYVQARNTDMEKTINGGACGTPAPGSTPGPRGRQILCPFGFAFVCAGARGIHYELPLCGISRREASMEPSRQSQQQHSVRVRPPDAIAAPIRALGGVQEELATKVIASDRPLAEIWGSNFWRGAIHGRDSWPVRRQLNPSSNSNLHHATLHWQLTTHGDLEE